MPVPMSRVLASLLACASLALWATPAGAADDRAATLATEVATLRAEVDRLRAELDAIKGMLEQRGAHPAVSAVSTAGAPAGQAMPQSDPRIDLLQSQVAELAQTKVESASRMPVRLFGTLHASAFTNSGEANWLDNPNIVAVSPGGRPRGHVQQRAAPDAPRPGVRRPHSRSVRTSGTVAFDFFGGIPGFQTGQVMGLPRLLVAFARFEGERTALHVGQDHVVLAPRDPTSLAAFAFPSLFRSGNLYLRAPQVRVERQLTSSLRVAGGLVAPNAGDLPGRTTGSCPPPSRVNARAGRRFRRGSATHGACQTTARRAALGVSGHYGSERRGGQLGASWAAASTSRCDAIGSALPARSSAGENIDAFGGATGLDARAAGGWAELQLFPFRPAVVPWRSRRRRVARRAATPLVPAGATAAHTAASCVAHSRTAGVVRVPLAGHASGRRKRAAQPPRGLGARVHSTAGSEERSCRIATRCCIGAAAHRDVWRAGSRRLCRRGPGAPASSARHAPPARVPATAVVYAEPIDVAAPRRPATIHAAAEEQDVPAAACSRSRWARRWSSRTTTHLPQRVLAGGAAAVRPWPVSRRRVARAHVHAAAARIASSATSTRR